MQNFVTVKIHSDLILPEVWGTKTPNEFVQLIRYRSIAKGYRSLWKFARKQGFNPNSFRLALLNLSLPPSSEIEAKIIKILAKELKLTITKETPPEETALVINKATWIFIPGIQRTALVRLLALHNGFKNLRDLASYLGFDNFEGFRMFISRGVNKFVMTKLARELNFTFANNYKLSTDYSYYFVVAP